MGEAKMKQYSREQFLRDHPICIYCGSPAGTTDHCPPKCFFNSRKWPEGYEFPACYACNQASKRDEQALAVLARAGNADKEPNRSEWQRLVNAVYNNQPEFREEWISSTFLQQKRYFSEVFGEKGFYRRAQGWRAIKFGPLTQAAIERFGVKLGKALYYRYNDEIFEGDIYIRITDVNRLDQNPDFLQSMLNFAPGLSGPMREKRSLADRFVYRFNHNAKLGAIYAVVQFGPQFMFCVMAVRKDLASQLSSGPNQRGIFHCYLKTPRGVIEPVPCGNRPNG